MILAVADQDSCPFYDKGKTTQNKNQEITKKFSNVKTKRF